jgi:tetratricopeptide (TPR) repeat protein
LSATGEGSPGSATIEALRATALEREAAGRDAEAAQTWEQLAAGSSGTARAAALAQQARLLEGPLDQAVEAERLYRRALANDPLQPAALEALSVQAAARGDWLLLANLRRRCFEAASEPLTKARIALEAGRFERDRLENPHGARIWYRCGLKCNPRDPELLQELVDLERDSGDDASLLDCVERLLDLQGDAASVATLLEAAALRSDLGEHARALGYLQRASRASPDDVLVLDALAEVLGQLDRCGDLADVLERRAALADDDPSLRANVLAQLGSLLEERLFDPEAALEAFERAQATHATEPGVAESLARLRAKLDTDSHAPRTPAAGADAAAPAGSSDLDAALRAYTREAQVTTDRVRLGILAREIERLQAQRGTPQNALPWIQRWALACPEDPEALRALARLHEVPGHETELTATLEALDPLLNGRNQIENRRRLGVLYARRGLPEEAARAFRSAAVLDPTDIDALEGLVAVLRELSQMQELVIAQLQLADQLEAPRRTRCLHEVAQLQNELGDLGGAIATLARLEREDREDSHISERLDALLERAGRFEELEARLVARCSDHEPGHAEWVALELRRAQLLETLSRVDEAAEVYRKALQYAPESGEAVAGLERVLRSSIDATGLADFLAGQARSASDASARDRALLERAVILDELLERSDEAREVYESLARSGADAELRLDASRRYARLLEQAGEWNELRTHLESALGRNEEAEEERLLERLARLCADRLRDEAGEIAYLERVVALNRTRSDVWRQLAERYAQDDRVDDLIQALEAQLEAGVDHGREISLRGRLADICVELTGDLQRAVRHYERLIELDPAHTAAEHFLTAHYRDKRRPDDLMRVLEGRLAALEAARPERRAQTAGERTSLRVQIAAVREEQLDDVEGAISALEVALGEAGPTPLVAAPLADCYQRAGYSLDLIELARNVTTRCEDPGERANWLVRLGDAFLARELTREAADAYRQALAERPDDRAVQASLRELYRQHGDADPLARLLEAEITHLAGSNEIPVRMELAELLSSRLDRPRDALLHVRRVLQIEPHHPAAFSSAQQLCQQLGDYGAALALLDARVESARTRRESASLLAERGRLLAGSLAQLERAVDDYRSSLDLDPGQPPLRGELSALLERLERWPELLETLALEAREALPEQRPEHLARIAEIAWAHLSPDAALPWLERLRRVRPEDSKTIARIAYAHRLADRIEPQLRALEEQASLVSDPEQRRVLQLERAALLESELAAPARALAVLEAAAQESPHDEEVLRHAERLQRVLGRHAERADSLEALLSAGGGRDVSLCRDLAELCDTELGDHDRAARYWEKALELVPRGSTARIEVLRALADSHRRAGRLEAWADYTEQELASLDPTPVFDDRRRELYRELALAYDTKLSRPDAALRYLRALLDSDAEPLLGAELRDRLEHACLRLLRCANDPTELEARLSRYLARNAEDVERWLELAQLREERMHATAAALEAYRQALTHDASCLPALRGLRRTAERLGRFTDVSEALEGELEHPECGAPDVRGGLLRRLGDICWHRLQSTTRASRYYAAALEVNAADFAALRALERLLEAMEDWRGALDLYESESEVLGDADPYRRRAIWLHVAALARDRTGENDRALRAFARAAEIEPLATAHLAEYAELYAQVGDLEAFVEKFAAWCEAPDARTSCADHVRLAEALEGLGREREALERIDAALARDDVTAAALDLAARLREAAGDTRGCADALRRAAGLLPDAEAAERLLRSAMLLEPLDADATLELLRSAVERNPAAARAQAARARLAAAHALHAEAEQAADAATSLPGDALEPVERIETLLLGGNAALACDRRESAAGFFTRALALAPDDACVTSAYGETMAALGDYAAARNALEARLASGQAYPERARHRALLGRCFEAEGALHDALACFEAALEDDPEHEEALAAAVRMCRSLSQVDSGIEAIERWARAAETPELRSERLLEAAEWELRAGDRSASAQAHLRAALDENPRCTRAWISLVRALFDEGRPADAVEAANRSALYVADEADLAALALLQGQAYEQQDLRPQAAESFGVAAEADPRCVDAVLAQARLLRGFGEWRAAADALEQFASRHPEPDAEALAEVYAQLGRLLAGPLEEVERAVACYRSAVALAPSDLEPRAALAELLSHRPDDLDEALGHLRMLIDVEPTDTNVLRVALRVARSRARPDAVASGLYLLRALGVASAFESDDHAMPAAAPPRSQPVTLDDPSFEKLRRLAEAASREIATALETPGEPEAPTSDAPEAAFRAAVLIAEGRLTAPALLPLPTREVAEILLLLATLLLDPEQIRGDGRRINALSGAINRRRRRKLTHILEGTSLEALRALDFSAWRSEVRALAAWQTLGGSVSDLRTALVALARERADVPDADLRAGADLTALVRGDATSRALLRRVARDWLAQI